MLTCGVQGRIIAEYFAKCWCGLQAREKTCPQLGEEIGDLLALPDNQEAITISKKNQLP